MWFWDLLGSDETPTVDKLKEFDAEESITFGKIKEEYEDKSDPEY